MRSRINVDRISVLSKNIIDFILTQLPIKEAVRTSILSRSWRYQWHYLSKITINSDDLLAVSQMERVKIIDHILLFHCGSVDMFKLNISLVADNDINRWILYLSRNGIKELIIKKRGAGHFNLSACIFSCSDLTQLLLTKCIFKFPPAEFKAFSNLTELFLLQVGFTNMTLEILVNSCPLLKMLGLVQVYHCPSLKINAPCLWFFHTRNFYCNFQFKNALLLEYASFGLESPVSSHIADSKDCKIVELLGSMPNLQELEFDDFALQHLAVGDVPSHLPLICRLEHLKACINFEDLQELLTAFCIFRSSPFIQHLELRVFGDKNTSRISANGFWEGEHNFSLRFDHLEIVRVTSFTGNETELKFIEFLLANAPALKTIEIEFSAGKDVKFLFNIVTKLVRFPRISPNAQLILPTYYDE